MIFDKFKGVEDIDKLEKIKKVVKIGYGKYLINDQLKLIITESGEVKAEFDDLTEEEVEDLIDEFFTKPVE